MSEELKPCPFCGGKAILLGGPQAQECHSVWCLECSAKMQGGMQSEPLVAKWNARHTPAVQVPEGYVKLGRVLAFVDAVATDAKGLRHEYVESRSGSMVKVPDFHALAAAPAPATATCSYPDCNCPFDLPDCARGLPKKAPATVAQGGGVDAEKVMALVEQYGTLRAAAAHHISRRDSVCAEIETRAAGAKAAQIRALLTPAIANQGEGEE